jgi:hypothetical protein
MHGFRFATAAALALAASLSARLPLHAAAGPIVLVWQPNGSPADVDDGVHLGVSEAQQTAKLLGREIRLEAAAAHPFAAIAYDADGVALKSAGCDFRLAPSTAERASLLDAWKKRNGKNGDYHVAVWHSSLKQFGGSDLNERFTRQFHRPMTEGAWLGWVAVKAALEAALRADGPACAAIRDIQFDGHKGALLSFRDGVLQQPLYIVESDAAGGKVVGQVAEK